MGFGERLVPHVEQHFFIPSHRFQNRKRLFQLLIASVLFCLLILGKALEQGLERSDFWTGTQIVEKGNGNRNSKILCHNGSQQFYQRQKWYPCYGQPTNSGLRVSCHIKSYGQRCSRKSSNNRRFEVSSSFKQQLSTFIGIIKCMI